jgi:hypothetical protein
LDNDTEDEVLADWPPKELLFESDIHVNGLRLIRYAPNKAEKPNHNLMVVFVVFPDHSMVKVYGVTPVMRMVKNLSFHSFIVGLQP